MRSSSAKVATQPDPQPVELFLVLGIFLITPSKPASDKRMFVHMMFFWA